MRITYFSILLLTLCATNAFADGGQVRVSKALDGIEATVFTAPTPLCAGPIDISVLLVDADSKKVIDNHEILIVARPRDVPGPPLQALATPDQATNKLLRAAKFDLPQPGWWQIDVLIETGATAPARLSFDAEVAPQPPRWTTFWPWFTWPLIALAIFGLHQWLITPRTATARDPRSRP